MAGRNHTLTFIFDAIKESVQHQKDELDTLSKGIFFAPELVLAFSMGKILYRDRAKIFNAPAEQITWKREVNIKNGGPSDIVFEVENRSGNLITYVIELKIRNTIDSYQADVDKLMRLTPEENKSYIKLFCALVDTFDKEDDLRIQKLEQNNATHLSRVDDFMIFKTIENNRYTSKDVYCVVGLWHVESHP